MYENATFFKTFDDLNIRYRTAVCPNAEAVAVIVHGIGEHSGRYTRLASFFNDRRCTTYLYDQRGHGESGGKRGHVKGFRDYQQDLDQLLALVKSQYPNLPVLLFGHSMGGVVAALYALDHPAGPAALILSSPGFVPAVKIPALKQLSAVILSCLLPSATFSSGLSADLLSHDRQEVQKYASDPLNHGQVSARWAIEFQKAGRECLRRAPELGMPLLIIHGQEDQIVDCRGSQQFHDKARSSCKKLVLLPGLYHECFNELPPGREQAFAVLDAWMAAWWETFLG